MNRITDVLYKHADEYCKLSVFIDTLTDILNKVEKKHVDSIYISIISVPEYGGSVVEMEVTTIRERTPKEVLKQRADKVSSDAKRKEYALRILKELESNDDNV